MWIWFELKSKKKKKVKLEISQTELLVSSSFRTIINHVEDDTGVSGDWAVGQQVSPLAW